MNNWLITFKQKKLKPSSYDRLVNVYKYHVKDTIGYIQLCNLTSKDIQTLINEKAETMSYSSVKKIYEIINDCLKYAVNEEMLRRNPIISVSLPARANMAVQKKDISIYSQDEVDKLVDNIYNNTFTATKSLYRYSPAFILALNTGLRVGELCALKWENVDMFNKFLRVNSSLSYVKTHNENGVKRKSVFTDPKTNTSNRLIPLNQKSILALEELQRRNKAQHIKSKYVVSDLKGGFVPQRNISRTLQNICDYAGIEYKGIHAMRHTFATNLITKGVDVRTVSDLLGHHNIQTTLAIYAHSIQENKVKAISSLDLL